MQGEIGLPKYAAGIMQGKLLLHRIFGMKTMQRLLCIILVSLLATPAFAAQLSVDLKTDYEFSNDFRTIRVSVLDQKNSRNQWMSFHTSDGDFVSGARIADFFELKSDHNYIVTTELLDDRMKPVDGSLTILSLQDGRNGMTVLISKP
jgi:hypothetical protein